MNNEQFRRLIQDGAPSHSAQSARSPNSPQNGGGTAHLLGSRTRPSIPMTPRAVSNNTSNTSAEFARQLADYKSQRQDAHGPPSKRFKSSAAPKGTKLASGYVDRTALRRADGSDQPSTSVSTEDLDKRKRLKALEEMVNLGQMDKATYLNLRKELGFEERDELGPRATGLDFELLERTRRGEISGRDSTRSGSLAGEENEDLDAALDKKVEEAVAPVQKEVQVKKGTLAATPVLTSSEAQGMTRDQILRRLKASRSSNAAGGEDAAVPEAPESTLGTKFKKINGGEKKRWIETDKNGRRKEIMLTTDKDGKSKRKVRWLDMDSVPGAVDKQDQKMSSSTGKGEILGMEIPAEILAKQKALLEQREAEEEDEDIFVGVGAEYDPLGNVNEGDDETSDSESEAAHEDRRGQEGPDAQTKIPGQETKTRDYFGTSTSAQRTDEPSVHKSLFSSDPTILAALKRAAALRQNESQDGESGALGTEEEDSAAKERHERFLENLRKRDREDAADMDFGFGESRFADEEDEDGPTWEDGEKKSGRKRGPKKRKGNKDSVNDVMSVLAGRSKDKP